MSSRAREAAVSEFVSTSFWMMLTLYDLSPSLRPSAASLLIASRMKGFASPKPANAPVSGAVKPILISPSPPPPPNLAAFVVPPVDAVEVLTTAVSVGDGAEVLAGAPVVPLVEAPVVPAGALVAVLAFLSLPHAARIAAAAAPPPSAKMCRRL
jgi:hypothetical protein